MVITMNGVVVEQMDVNPTMSLNSIDTLSWVFASIVSPEMNIYYVRQHRVVSKTSEVA